MDSRSKGSSEVADENAIHQSNANEIIGQEEHEESHQLEELQQPMTYERNFTESIPNENQPKTDTKIHVKNDMDDDENYEDDDEDNDEDEEKDESDEEVRNPASEEASAEVKESTFRSIENRMQTQKTNSEEARLKFWQVTDIHLDYKYDANGDPKKWCHEDANPETSAGRVGNYRCDGTRPVLLSAVKTMKVEEPEPDFILWTGDSSPHSWDPTQPDWNYIFTVERDIVSMLRKNFPTTLILPSLGNHDSFPADFFPDDNATFYESFMVASNWTTLLPTDAQGQFAKCGFYRYDYRPPRQSNHNLVFIVLNTNLYYRTGYPGSSDPCGQLAWFDRQLANATSVPDNRILIAAHVPPGFFERDPSFGVFMKDPKGYDGINDRYVDIVNKHTEKSEGGKVVAHIYGHTHTDSFRLFKAAGKEQPLSVAFIGASITPLVNGAFSTNPSIRLYHYDNVSRPYLDNYQQFYMDLEKANRETEIVWRPLYDFKAAFGVPDLSLDSVNTVHQAMKSDNSSDDRLKKFLHYSTVAKTTDIPECNDECQTNLVCAMDSLTQAEMDTCLQAASNSRHIRPQFLGIVVLTAIHYMIY